MTSEEEDLETFEPLILYEDLAEEEGLLAQLAGCVLSPPTPPPEPTNLLDGDVINTPESLLHRTSTPPSLSSDQLETFSTPLSELPIPNSLVRRTGQPPSQVSLSSEKKENREQGKLSQPAATAKKTSHRKHPTQPNTRSNPKPCTRSNTRALAGL